MVIWNQKEMTEPEVMKMQTKFWSETVKLAGKKVVAGPRAVTGREGRKMGVEIEFFGVNRLEVIRALRAAGIAVEWEGYTHRTTAHWKLVTDSSVTSTGTGAGRGLELVSPPLAEAEMMRQLEIVCRVLGEIGAKVDKTCGLHVHHHIDDFTVEDVKNLYRLYFKHTLAIEQIMPRSRRASVNPQYCRGISDRMMERLEQCQTIQEIASKFSRYHVINMTAYLKYGTVEFRQHSGTIEFVKIANWLKITQAIVATAKNKKKIKMTGVAKTIVHQNWAFLEEMGLRNTEQAAYFMERKEAFRELNKIEHERAAG